MNIFFDVDYTLLSTDNGLRPGTRELFERLVGDGHTLYVWSGVGMRWDFIHEFGLEELVTDVFVKPTFLYRRRLAELGVHVSVDFAVDDTVEVVHAFGGFTVEPYWFAERPDDELSRVYDAIAQRVARNL